MSERLHFNHIFGAGEYLALNPESRSVEREDRGFPLRILSTVRSMNHVRGYRDRQVPTYGPRLGSQRICCSNDLPKCLNCIRPLENNEDYRTRSHMVDQFLEKRLPLMHIVKRLGLF